MKDLREYWQVLEEFHHKNEPCLLATVIRSEGSVPRKIGAKAILNQQGQIVWGTVGGGAVEHNIQQEASKILHKGQTICKTFNLEEEHGVCGGSMEILLEPHGVRPTAIIIGGGHIGQALAPLLLQLEFNVIILDPREDLREKSAFTNIPVITGKTYTDLVNSVDVQGDVYYIIATYEHEGDEEALIECLKRPYTYLGMIGSNRKVKILYKRLIEKKFATKEQLDKVHSPIGLPIHSETPAEIAVSIAGEIIKIRAERRK